MIIIGQIHRREMKKEWYMVCSKDDEVKKNRVVYRLQTVNFYALWPTDDVKRRHTDPIFFSTINAFRKS
jgi:hypothetical protein